MLQRYTLSVFILLCAMFSSAYGQTMTPKEEVQQAITRALSLYEDGKYLTFIEEYANIPLSPEMKANLTKIFEEDPQVIGVNLERLVKAIKQAQTLEPTFSNDNTQASFKVDNYSSPLVFSKVNGQWKIND